MSTNISVNGGTIINIRKNPGNDIIIEYSLNDTNVWNTINFPCLITNINTENGFVKVYFTTNIDITNINQYFSCNSNNVQFGSDSLNLDGTRPIINVKTNYCGFIDNISGYNNILIFNLFINGIDGDTTYSTEADAGWIARNYFKGSNNYIINCSSNGNIGGEGSGGIVGANSSYGGFLALESCSSSGMIIGQGGGGIFGKNAYQAICNSCWSLGSILADDAGGIIGKDCYICQITNSYSTGEIFGIRSGGIAGTNSSIYCIILNSYSTGNISGNYAGGICGSVYASIVIINCYTTGDKTGNNAGGILGYINNSDINIIIIQNCYVTGENLFGNGYIVSNDNGDQDVIIYINEYKYINITKCYSEAYHNSFGWNDIHASNASKGLTGAPLSGDKIGVSWVSTVEDTPYYIFEMGYTPYSNKIIYKNTETEDYKLIRTYSSSIVQGQFSTTAIINSLSYQKLKITGGDTVSQNSITIDSYDGKISTLSSTSPEKYTIYISNIGYNNSLYFTTYELTVNILLKSPIIYMKSLFTDNSLVYYKPHSLSCGGVGTIKNQRAKCHKT